MNITYIHHSSFLVETDHAVLLFDYFKGKLPKFDSIKPLYVFASHRHGDHFDPVIFQLANQTENITFILSDDIWQNRVPETLHSKVIFMGPGEEKTAGGLRIKTYRSTDEGVAFIVWTDAACIYHAGDLNNWTWIGESDNWNKQMAENYHMELEKMKGTSVDIAFIPLDSRLQEWFYLGIDDFMKKVGCRYLFPMHFWEDYSVIGQLRNLPCARNYRDKIMDLQREGETFHVRL